MTPRSTPLRLCPLPFALLVMLAAPPLAAQSLQPVPVVDADAPTDARTLDAVVGRNLLDRVQAIGAVDFNNYTGFYNEPRVLGVELAVRL